MVAKPKKADYGASASEGAASGVANSRLAVWKEKFSPLLVERGKVTQTGAVDKTLSGRAQADVAQKLTKGVSLAATEAVEPTGELAQAIQGQQGAAHTTALGVKNTEGAGVLGRAQGLAGTAAQGLVLAAQQGSSKKLGDAANKLAERQAVYNAAAKVGATWGSQMYENASMAGVNKTGELGSMDWSKAFTPQMQVANTTGAGKGHYESVTPWQGLWNAFGKGSKET